MERREPKKTTGVWIPMLIVWNIDVETRKEKNIYVSSVSTVTSDMIWYLSKPPARRRMREDYVAISRENHAF